jgi:hypothetical protein
LTTPTLTPLQNCTLILEKIDPLLKFSAYAPVSKGACPDHKSGLYVSMLYGSEIFEDDLVL